MSSPLLSRLPLELLLRIGNFLLFEDRIKFASLNSQLRQILAPELFSTIRITNRKEDLDLIQHVVTKFAQCVRGLHFQCHLYQLDDEGVEAAAAAAAAADQDRTASNEQLCELPDDIAKLLLGDTLEQLQALTIEFVPDDNFEGEKWSENDAGSIHHFEFPEDEDEMQQHEKLFPWRKLMSRVWDVVSSNVSIVALKIVNLPPRRTSTWSGAKWKSFLSRLQDLSIGLWGGDNGVGWHANSHDGYRHFLETLDQCFFSHSSNLLHLEIVAHEDNPYGCTGPSTAPLALYPHHLTHLKALDLKNCVIDYNLVIFLKARSKNLQQLALIECKSIIEYEETDDAISWAGFWREIQASKPVLESLLVTNFHVPLPESETDEVEPDQVSNNEPKYTKSPKQSILRKGKQLFPYFNTDEKYGTLMENEDENLSRFETGDDQREYNNLMSLVKVNASAGTRSKTSAQVLGGGKLEVIKNEEKPNVDLTF